MYQILTYTENFDFLDQICPKRVFLTKVEKVNITIAFRIFKLLGVPNFTLNKRFWMLGPNLPKTWIFGQKRKKLNITIKFYIFDQFTYDQFYVPVFSLNWQFWLGIIHKVRTLKFGKFQTPPPPFYTFKKQNDAIKTMDICFCVYRRWILHIRISLQSFTKYLRQTLVFMSGRALQEGFIVCFSGDFY